MHGGKKRGPPKHLEKMLFTNHKEDQLLDCRLQDLKVQARLRLIELDLERVKVTKELRKSRKKQITINEAILSGLIPRDDNFFAKKINDGRDVIGDVKRGASKSASLPRKLVAPNAQLISRSTSFIQPPRERSRVSIPNQFSRQSTIPEEHEECVANDNGMDFRTGVSSSSVGAYVLEEFEKISQVVPEILRALAKKKEQQQESDEMARLRELRKEKDLEAIIAEDEDYVPDMNKVRKTVSAVKTLRQRMSLSKKLEMSKKHKPLEEMIREKTESIKETEHTEYTDGTCALMKRRLEKKRRESAPFALDPSYMQRRSSGPSADALLCRRASVAPEMLNRRSSLSVTQLPGTMRRSMTTLSLTSINKPSSSAFGDASEGSQFIDEDTLLNRQRVMKEVQKYRALQTRVENFVTSTRYLCPPTNVFVVPI
ncbi:uncharacterized protein LOC127850340 [Dreissena polymorpha]|uniref:Uncharacterized protein n=1 Tax=Dreissena polymorpha TaxID=45954 RepID=A0A9D4I1W8_DREPO|nr:uncharacterized protein LOC127850340 [Dreissena polymorpha]KAH3739376.1 hypothetical protein DPMN_046028 [Dreissena polymorpha]